MSLLIPVFHRAQMAVQSATCLNNLRQLGTAMNAYLHDNNEKFPKPAVNVQYEDWIYWNGGRNPAGGRIIPYLGGIDAANKILVCPSNTGNTYVPSYPYSYSVNEFMCRYFYDTISITQVQNPSQKIMAICESSQTIDDGCWAAQNYLDGEFVNLLSNRHDMAHESRYDYLISDDLSGRGNVVFADFHADMVSRANSLDPNFYMAYPNEPVR
jgi:prepilin-type processing-associated H-X9-DG protein